MLKPEVDSLVPHVPFNRRTFIKAALGSGFAAAVLPVSAQTIHTDSEGLEAGEIGFESGGTLIPAYRAQPRGKTHLPVVIVIHEIFGVHEHIADVCRRFAKLGYLAIAPDFFVRQGDASVYPTIQQINDNIASKVPDAQVMGDIDAAVAWAGGHGGDTKRVGVNGFCWGGRYAWLYAEHNPHIKAAVVWYGRVAGPHTANAPSNPLDLANTLQVPVLAMYGLQDTSIPQDTLEQMKAAIAQGPQGGRSSQIVVYNDAGHAFFADYRPSYRKADAQDGWKRAIAWFREHGVV
ncbi:dienelactone hydrolase family protein [Paraburkholderia silvatlantica]|uniref:Carboxymethylenebutenolidase n=1 Tax=Paraburkholderia silvatlantica TaxID=321895 RepID=A0A2U1A7L8_9BURK|nr:dienelactone hydrolase family protein [Paraburkholderia silvatlantica]MBB2931316.1 carboxymethylenebutenolidase [Paraburkholderia silvatlantica]PVY28249.1 carboxymethylenebutenolidase [Paraburkholderia silvatlantica]PXW34934.1 carboxymethylenebutenolidase [Paraburkholderia silvatlantica]PYE15241.1 carboxymethylenebutenolidase [Paraburkholderia silvatlantica]TDQ98841.1 carboxymethylenebutenolidase [Paraburkholderia silvatlantica]